MDQEQVDIVGAQRLQRLVERTSCFVGFMKAVVELARHEHVGAVDSGVADTLPDLALIAVHLRGVDVAIADVQRGPDGLGGVIGVDLVHAEAQLWDARAVVELDAWETGHG